MKALFNSMIREETGSVLVIVTLSLVTLLGVSAMVVDAGLAYTERVKLNNAVDAAALAGAQEMADSLHAHQAEKVARDYAALNIADVDALKDLDVIVDNETKKVTVSARKTMDLFFARVLDFFEVDIGARAAAVYQYPTSVTRVKNGNVLPLFMSEDIYKEALNGETIGLMGEDNFHVKIDGEEIPGNWGGLDFGGGTSTFVSALEGELDMAAHLETEEWYEEGTKTGTMGINVKKAVENREANGINSYGLIPIVSDVEDKGGGKVEVLISKFAVFNITETQKESPGWTIYGHLKKDVTVADYYGSTTTEESYNHGARVLTLVE